MTLKHPTSQMVYSVFLLGSITLASYYFVLPLVKPNEPLSVLWFGVPKHIQPLYYASIFLSGIVFIASFAWIVFHITDIPTIQKLTTAYIIFLIGAIGWSMMLWWWGTTEKNTMVHTLSQVSVVASLTLTTLGIVLLVYYLWEAHRRDVFVPWWCFASVFYLLFHVFVLDNIHWTCGFLKA